MKINRDDGNTADSKQGHKESETEHREVMIPMGLFFFQLRLLIV